MIPRISKIQPCDQYILRVTFDGGRQVMYDVKDDIAQIPDFKQLQQLTGLFEAAQLDESRTCIFWNDRIDIPSDWIWEYGKDL